MFDLPREPARRDQRGDYWKRGLGFASIYKSFTGGRGGDLTNGAVEACLTTAFILTMAELKRDRLISQEQSLDRKKLCAIRDPRLKESCNQQSNVFRIDRLQQELAPHIQTRALAKCGERTEENLSVIPVSETVVCRMREEEQLLVCAGGPRPANVILLHSAQPCIGFDLLQVIRVGPWNVASAMPLSYCQTKLGRVDFTTRMFINGMHQNDVYSSWLSRWHEDQSTAQQPKRAWLSDRGETMETQALLLGRAATTARLRRDAGIPVQCCRHLLDPQDEPYYQDARLKSCGRSTWVLSILPSGQLGDNSIALTGQIRASEGSLQLQHPNTGN